MSHHTRRGMKSSNVGGILFCSVLGWAVAALLGLLSAWICRSFGLSNMAAAQITIGMVGFGGGWSHSLLIKKAGGQASWKQHILLSVIWALTCIGGATPLFFVMGSAWKMEMIALYSFAASGALGGMATSLVTRPFFSDDYARNGISCTLIWSFSLGLAAVVSDLFGEALQTFFSPAVAWVVASGVAVLVIGCGGGFSLTRFLVPAEDGKAKTSIFPSVGDRPFADTRKRDRLYIWALFLLCAPFYLNDFSNMYVVNWRLWLLIDYTSVKLFPFLVVFWMVHIQKMQISEFGWTPQKATPFLAALFLGTLTVTYIVQNGDLFLNWLPGYPALGKMPEINSPIWRWIDLTIGLLMVGIFEELVFRGYLSTFISRYTRRPWIVISASAMAFGFIHWSGGLHTVLMTAAAGAVLMVLYLQTRSLPGIMLAHFAVDFVDAVNLLPKPVPIP